MCLKCKSENPPLWIGHNNEEEQMDFKYYLFFHVLADGNMIIIFFTL